MFTYKRKKAALAACALLVAAGLLAGCAAQAAGSGSTDTGTSAAAGADTDTGAALAASSYDNVKDEDLNDSWDEADATMIALGGEGIGVKGAGAEADGSTLTITQAGTYVLTGALDDGQIVIEAPDDALVRLVLNGVNLHNEDGAAIYCVSADKLVLVLAEGSENVVSDGESYTFPNSETDEPNAAIFSQQDLTVNGTGRLVVSANYNNGIGTKDDLILVSGEIEVTATNNAVRGRDSVTVIDAALVLDAGNDGIQSNSDAGTDKGWITLYGGSYDITAGHDGIQAETSLTVYDGSYTITTGGGSANAPERAEEAGFGGAWGGNAGALPGDGAMPGGGTLPEGGTPPEGMPEGMPAQADRAQAQAAAETATASETATADEATDADAAAGTDDAAAETESDSFKALKAGTDLAVEGGSFAIDSADDAFHANGGLTVGGGSFTVATGDDGFHADEDLLIEGQPVIDITTCYEGLEGGNVTVNSGDITINATDDGVNAAGGSGNGAAAAGAFGPDQFAGGGDYTITINGGSLRVTAAFDGLDSNGDIWITGGEVAVSAAGTEALGGDGAIDCDGSFAITGGTLAAAGGSAFVVMGSGGASINAGGSQPVLNFQFTDEQPAKTTIALQDESGNTLVSYTADKAFKTVALSSPELQSGESYTVTADGEAVYTVTLSGNLTSISDTGASVDTAMGPGAGGMGGRGGTGL